MKNLLIGSLALCSILAFAQSYDYNIAYEDNFESGNSYTDLTIKKAELSIEKIESTGSLVACGQYAGFLSGYLFNNKKGIISSPLQDQNGEACDVFFKSEYIER